MEIQSKDKNKNRLDGYLTSDSRSDTINTPTQGSYDYKDIYSRKEESQALSRVVMGRNP